MKKKKTPAENNPKRASMPEANSPQPTKQSDYANATDDQVAVLLKIAERLQG